MKFSIQSVYTWYRNLLRNPKYRWWVVLGTLLYMVSPIDIAPDFIPVIGQIDDVFLLTLLISEISGLVIEGWKARKGNVNSEAPYTSESSTSTPAQLMLMLFLSISFSENWKLSSAPTFTVH